MNHIVQIHSKSPPHKKYILCFLMRSLRLEPQAGLIYSTISSIFQYCREIFARHSMLKTAENTVKLTTILFIEALMKQQTTETFSPNYSLFII